MPKGHQVSVKDQAKSNLVKGKVAGKAAAEKAKLGKAAALLKKKQQALAAKKKLPDPPSDEDSGDDASDESTDQSSDESSDEDTEMVSLSKNSLAVDMNKYLKETAKDDFGYKGGGGQGGLYSATKKDRPERDKREERVPQLLQQITTMLLRDTLAKVKAKEFEVQALYVPGDDASTSMLLMTGNQQATVKHLSSEFESVRDSIEARIKGKTASERRQFGKLRDIIAEDSDDEGSRVAKLRADEDDDGDEDSDIAQLIKLIKAEQCWQTVDINGAADALGSRAGGVYLVTPKGKTHAELTLMVALIRSGLKGVQSYLQGSKRPCTGCYLATRYARENFDLDGVISGIRPGKLFGQAPATGLAAIAIEGQFRASGDYEDEDEVGLDEWEEFTDGLKAWIRTKFPTSTYISQINKRSTSSYDTASDSDREASDSVSESSSESGSESSDSGGGSSSSSEDDSS